MQLGGVLLYLKKFEVTRCVINESPLLGHDKGFLKFLNFGRLIIDKSS